MVAFANYAKVFKDPYFGKTLITTLLFVLGSTVLPYTLGMIWAIDLNQGFKGAEFLRGVTLVNWIIPGTAIGFLWSWIFNGQYGILNSILKALGILETGIPWLGQTNTALLCVIIARTWQMLPWYMAFLLGGLQSVSLDQIEAAHIDGANNWTTFWHIILPGMKQTAVAGVHSGTHWKFTALRPAVDDGAGRPRAGDDDALYRGLHNGIQKLEHGQGRHGRHDLGNFACDFQHRLSAAAEQTGRLRRGEYVSKNNGISHLFWAS